MTNASETTDRRSRSAVRAAEGILSTLVDGVWRIQIDRTSKRNALTMTMFSALAESLALAQADEAVRAITLSGLGPNFCAGHDLSAFDSWPQGPGDPVPRFLHALADVRKPLLVGVHGSAAGIGVTMLLHAYWVIAPSDAVMKLPFVDLGIVPEAGSSLLLARAIGALRARRLLLGGDAFTGQQAHDWGLVSELAPANELATCLQHRALALAAKDTKVYGRIKALLVPAGELRARIDEEIDLINTCVAERRALQTG